MPSEFRTKNLAIEFARLCLKLKVPFSLQDQLHRAACSIPLNLSEGSARHTPKDRHKFYRTALGSFREVETLLEILKITENDLEVSRKQLAGSLVNLCKATQQPAK